MGGGCQRSNGKKIARPERHQYVGVEIRPMAAALSGKRKSTARGDDELDLVVRLEMIQVLPKVAVHLSRVWRLQVDDSINCGRHVGNGNSAAGFQEYGEAFVQQAL